jgi:hypothetical protein
VLRQSRRGGATWLPPIRETLQISVERGFAVAERRSQWQAAANRATTLAPVHVDCDSRPRGASHAVLDGGLHQATDSNQRRTPVVGGVQFYCDITPWRRELRTRGDEYLRGSSHTGGRISPSRRAVHPSPGSRRPADPGRPTFPTGCDGASSVQRNSGHRYTWRIASRVGASTPACVTCLVPVVPDGSDAGGSCRDSCRHANGNGVVFPTTELCRWSRRARRGARAKPTRRWKAKSSSRYHHRRTGL